MSADCKEGGKPPQPPATTAYRPARSHSRLRLSADRQGVSMDRWPIDRNESPGDSCRVRYLRWVRGRSRSSPLWSSWGR